MQLQLYFYLNFVDFLKPLAQVIPPNIPEAKRVNKRFNLYYIFLEDKERQKLSKEKSEAIRKNIEEFYRQFWFSRRALPDAPDRNEAEEDDKE